MEYTEIYCDMCGKELNRFNNCQILMRRGASFANCKENAYILCPDCYQTICECINDNRKVIEDE